jgi:hypothetical protein
MRTEINCDSGRSVALGAIANNNGFENTREAEIGYGRESAVHFICDFTRGGG